MQIVLATLGVLTIAWLLWRAYAARSPRQIILRLVTTTFTDAMKGIDADAASMKALGNFRSQNVVPLAMESFVLAICQRAYEFGQRVEAGELQYRQAIVAININVNTLTAMAGVARDKELPPLTDELAPTTERPTAKPASTIDRSMAPGFVESPVRRIVNAVHDSARRRPKWVPGEARVGECLEPLTCPHSSGAPSTRTR